MPATVQDVFRAWNAGHSATPRIPEEIWAEHKSRIHELHKRKDMTLAELMMYMKETYEFTPSNQWTRKLKEWNLRKYDVQSTKDGPASSKAPTDSTASRSISNFLDIQDFTPERYHSPPPSCGSHGENTKPGRRYEIQLKEGFVGPQTPSSVLAYLNATDIPYLLRKPLIEPATGKVCVAYYTAHAFPADSGAHPTPGGQLAAPLRLSEEYGYTTEPDEDRVQEEGPPIAPSLCSSDFSRFRKTAHTTTLDIMSVDELVSHIGTLPINNDIAGKPFEELSPMDMIDENLREVPRDESDYDSKPLNATEPDLPLVDPIETGAWAVHDHQIVSTADCGSIDWDLEGMNID